VTGFIVGIYVGAGLTYLGMGLAKLLIRLTVDR
jgi:hypothetical protein